MPVPVSAPTSRTILRFGTFELDLQIGELRKSGIRVKLQPQPFRILTLLLENAGELVSRDELSEKFWPAETYVEFDRSLNRAIVKLRDTLGDTAESPRFIETVPKRGYRFIAPVTRSPILTPEPVAVPEPPRRFVWKPLVIGLLTLALGVGAYLLVRQERKANSTAIRSIAVLPMENFSGDPAQQYFADGMTDELITMLARNTSNRISGHSPVLRG
jgi:DNA-binding winged helix-turn-helix (wHTH) protein